MMRTMYRLAAVLIALLLTASLAPGQREFRSATRFDPPAESFNAPDSLRVLEAQLKVGRFVEAATAIESLLRDSAYAITPTDERGSMSVENWLDVAAAPYLRDIGA